MKRSLQSRLKLVETALELGVTKSAKLFGYSRVTVYKWLRRYQEQGFEGLKERSRRPHHHPRKISPELEARILAIRRENPFLGPRRIKAQFGLPCSESTIYRVLKRHGLLRERKR
ncbi:MAG: helix-turn-helix domain-containing protein [Calditrichaeota bacterium]|nr:MAG: helix-turn-helix domain-containing protein [Calditrichota bacterium]